VKPHLATLFQKARKKGECLNDTQHNSVLAKLRKCKTQ
jgi:hypothetical protein